MRALLREGKDRFGTPIPEPLVPAFHLDELQQLMRPVRYNRLISRLQGLCLGFNFQGGTKRDMRREGLV